MLSSMSLHISLLVLILLIATFLYIIIELVKRTNRHAGDWYTGDLLDCTEQDNSGQTLTRPQSSPSCLYSLIPYREALVLHVKY